MKFNPSNSFEMSLLKVATNPQAIPQFYEEFLKAEIYVIQDVSWLQNLTPNANTLGIQQVEWEGRYYIPIFSSLERARFAQKNVCSTLALKVTELLRAVKDHELLLNPGFEYGKKFSREEIQSLLDGSIWQQEWH